MIQKQHAIDQYIIEGLPIAYTHQNTNSRENAKCHTAWRLRMFVSRPVASRLAITYSLPNAYYAPLTNQSDM